MSAKFGVNTIVYTEDGSPVKFSIGDDVPEWAEGRFGDHCLAVPAAEVSVPIDPNIYEDMPVSKLRKIAHDLGVELHTNKKSEIITALEAFNAGDAE